MRYAVGDLVQWVDGPVDLGLVIDVDKQTLQFRVKWHGEAEPIWHLETSPLVVNLTRGCKPTKGEVE